jgi:hypothetical protein
MSALRSQTRQFKSSNEGSQLLGPFELLPGTWRSEGFGWNLIALPFANAPFRYRLLMNQYNETLKFALIDERVPNRGVPTEEFPPDPELPENEESDQFITTLDYEQTVRQVASSDFPVSGLAGGEGLPIHHEPGLFLNMLNKKNKELDIARLATVPHGDSVLALGKSEVILGAPEIPVANGLPLRISQDLSIPYLEPYKVFVENPFKGNVDFDGFPGFNPLDANVLLRLANQGVSIKRTTILPFDTTLKTGGIVNIPFIVRQANAAEMQATFWIQELDELDIDGNPVLRLQYTQNVLLDFFKAPGSEELIRWPHISINTLTKIPKSQETSGKY